jgi:hypothetical protein
VTIAALCPIAQDVDPTEMTAHGVVTTHRNAWKGQVFRRITRPACRHVSLWPDSKTALKAWRGQSLLPWEFRSMMKTWPVEVDLAAAIVLGVSSGFESWRAQVCLNGLLDHDPEAVLAVEELFETADGIMVPSPTGRLTLIVREDAFGSSVRIGEPGLIRDQGERSRARR